MDGEIGCKKEESFLKVLKLTMMDTRRVETSQFFSTKMFGVIFIFLCLQ